MRSMNPTTKTTCGFSYRLWVIVGLCISIIACSTPNITAPKQQVQSTQLPSLEASVIQAPIVLPTAELKALLQRYLPSPLLAGTTPRYNFKVANRKPAARKNWLDRLAKPLLEWVDENIDAAAKFSYRLELTELDLWFEERDVHIDLKIDIQLDAKWENGIQWQGKKQLFNNNLACPLQLRIHLDGEVALNEDTALELTLYEEQAQFEITKLCSSKILQQVDWPELLEPLVQPVLRDLTKTINTTIAQQVQRLLNSSTGQNYRNFQPLIDRAAQYLNEPYALQEGIWLQPNVQQLFVSPLRGLGRGANNRLELSVGAVAQPVVVLQAQRPATPKLPPLTFGVQPPQAHSQLYVKGQLPLKDAAKQLQTYLKDYVAREYASYNYTVGAVTIYPKGGRAIVSIELWKDNNPQKITTLYIAGVPQFDAQRREFYLEDFTFTADSKNWLLHLAKWFRQGELLKRLQENARFDARAEMQALEAQLQQIDMRQDLGRIHGSLHQLQVIQAGINNAHFEAYLLATGVLQAEVYWGAW